MSCFHQFRPGADFFAAVEVFDLVMLLRVEAAKFHGQRFVRGFGTTEGLHNAFAKVGAMELPRDPRSLVEAVGRERVVVAEHQRADAADFAVAANRPARWLSSLVQSPAETIPKPVT